MWKEKENGLIDVGPVELEEPMKSDAPEVLTPEEELGKELFCRAWPAIARYLSGKASKVKNPIFKWLAKAGLGIADGWHDVYCKE